MDSLPTSLSGSRGSSPAADLDLIERARRGDVDAVDELVRRLRCVPRILAAIDRHYGNRFDAHELADLAQDAVVLMWRKLATFSGQGTIETWAYGIGRFEYLNATRHKSFQEGRRADLDAETQVAAEQRHECLDAEDLQVVLDRIPVPEATVVRLKHALDMTFEEIGQELSISPSTAKTRYYRGLQTLARELCAGEARRRET